MWRRLALVLLAGAALAGRGDAHTYRALATAHRVDAPCAKLAFADWWATAAWSATPERHGYLRALSRVGPGASRSV